MYYTCLKFRHTVKYNLLTIDAMPEKKFIKDTEVYSVLNQYNPWWYGKNLELPRSRRTAFQKINTWILTPPAKRAVVINGARQVGKTTLVQQVIQSLILEHKINPLDILYITFDHPMFSIIGPDKLIEIWQSTKQSKGREYIFFDEIQYAKNWQVWLKHQVDFSLNRRIVVTGSAIPIEEAGTESGVGRWHTIKLPTLSFYEFLKIKNIPALEGPGISSFQNLFSLSKREELQIIESAKALVPYFNEYILKGGFPQIAQIEDIDTAQQLVREDILDKVLKRDMTSIFGVRHVTELEKFFLYLCLNDGGIIEINSISSALGLAKQTITNFLNILEAAHLIYKLRPLHNSKGVLKGKQKVYMADPALAGSVLLKGRSLLEDHQKLGTSVECAFIKHIISSANTSNFYYWQGKNQNEVDLICKTGKAFCAFEVKYSSSPTSASQLKGLLECCSIFDLKRAYVITSRTFGALDVPLCATKIFNIPIYLACYWIGENEQKINLQNFL